MLNYFFDRLSLKQLEKTCYLVIKLDSNTNKF
uniref:Uncharacterized protein n=1 Tax=Aquilaria malaccensis TaxID=223753 RepID=A0A4Y6GLG5_9ROSI|nr:hypothetical protein [Aquilaria malaccensis]